MNVRSLKRRFFATRVLTATVQTVVVATYNVFRKKDNVLVEAGVSAERAKELIEKAAKAKKASLYCTGPEPLAF